VSAGRPSRARRSGSLAFLFDGLQGVAEREPFRSFAQAELLVVALDHECLPERHPRDVAVLLQRGQPHPFVEQGGDDLAQAVVELDSVRLVELALVGDVADRPVEASAAGCLEVRVLDHEQPVVAGVAHRLEHRVAVADEQPPARPEQGGDDGRPPADVGKPVQRPDAGVDEVEALAAQHVGCLVDIGDDELDVGTGPGGEVTGGLDRRRREVEARDPGALASTNTRS
jgi:hypothetical protein